MARPASLVNQGYFKTPVSEVQRIASVVGLNPYVHDKEEFSFAETGLHRLLDPCCGTGEALNLMAYNSTAVGRDMMSYAHKATAEFDTYGVEINSVRAQQARRSVKYVLNTDIASTEIGQGMATVLYLNPPYDDDSEFRRLEHAFLVRTTPMLSYGGLLVFIVPRARLRTSAAYLSEHYSDIQYWTFEYDEYQVFKQTVLIGKRRNTGLPSNIAEQREQNKVRQQIVDWSKGTEVSPGLPDERVLVNAAAVRLGRNNRRPRPVFARLRFNRDAALEEARESGYMASQLFTDLHWPESFETDCQPLIPMLQQHLSINIMGGMFNSRPIKLGNRYMLLKGSTTKVEHQSEEDISEESVKVVTIERPLGTIVTLDMETGEFTDYS